MRVIGATVLFASLHSALASRSAKRATAALLGERNRNGLYRVFYIGQSLASFAALAYFVRRQPSKTIYHVKGPAALPLRGAQIASLGMATFAAREVGLSRITGLESFRQWRRVSDVQPEPEAQGPSEQEGELRVAGPFRWSRHPLNFWPLPIFWLNPRMTTSLLAFNVAASIYLVVGSLHEEVRLKAAYGRRYTDYQRSRVPVYFPSLRRLLRAAGLIRTINR